MRYVHDDGPYADAATYRTAIPAEAACFDDIEAGLPRARYLNTGLENSWDRAATAHRRDERSRWS